MNEFQRAILILLILTTLSHDSASAQSAPGDEHWDYRFGLPGADGAIISLLANGNDVYAGGSLNTSFGNVSAASIAKWDGLNWTALGSGITSDSQAIVTRMALGTNGDLYVAGSFTAAGGVAATNIARWNGVSWSPLGNGITGVGALAVKGKDLYVGGSFTNVGSLNIKGLARWNGTNWSAVSGGVAGGTNLSIGGLLVDGNNLYVGGNLTNAGGMAVNAMARWDGTNWSALGSGLTGPNVTVNAILKRGTNLLVSGSFTNAGGITASNIARWDGSQWSALGSGVPAVATMAVVGENVFVAGRFSVAGGVAVTNVARWDGTNWSNLGGLSVADPTAAGTDFIYALATTSDGQLFAGGNFSKAGTNAVQNLARWDGTNWDALGANSSAGLSGASSTVVYGLATNAGALYAGGIFYTAGRAVVSQAARWDGTNWSGLGAGIVGKMTLGRVAAVAFLGADCFIGGTFTNAGGIVASNLAKWNGANWSAVGSGMNNSVTALTSDGTSLYAGGSFNVAGGLSAANIARWNGSSWSALGLGVNNTVSALANGADGIYVGGNFTTAGGVPASRIARWDGANWNALGSGVDASVRAIVVSGSTVYVGGTFANAGGSPASMIAKWDGTNWSSLGTGIQGTSVYALAVLGNRLYVGGQFTKAGGLNATNVACWDGNSWIATGSGVSASSSANPIGAVFAAAAWNNELIVAGSFQRIGQKPAYRIGAWNDQTVFLPTTTMQLGNPLWLPNGRFQFRAGVSGGASYVLEATTNLSTWLPLLTNSTSAFDFTNPALPVWPLQFYRLRQLP